MALFDNEIQPRGWSRADLGLPHLTERQLESLKTSTRRLYGDLGIEISDGKVPFSHQSYVPRMYVMALNEKNEETTKSLEQINAPVGSGEFWRQVQLGNVFAFPAGSTSPVQLQLRPNQGNGDLDLQYSKPVTPEAAPAAPAKPLGFWKRAAWLATFGNAFNKQRLEYKNRAVSAQNHADKLKTFMSERQKAVQTELAEKAALEEADRQLEETYRRDPYAPGMRFMTELYQPEPEYNRRNDSAFHHNALYNREEFNTLTQYDKDQIDLSQIKPDGKAVSKEEFASVAALGVWQPEITMTAITKPDPYLNRALKSAGIQDEQIPRVITAGRRSFVTTDMFVKPPRGNAGPFYKTTVNAGREAAVKAFQDYAKGDPTKLAKLVGEGVNLLAKDLRELDASQVSSQLKGTLAISNQVLGLLERDSKLMKAAEDAGMEPEHFRTLKGARKLMQMDQAAANALADLQDAAEHKRPPLSPAQKTQLLKTVLKQKIACAKIAGDNLKESPEYTEKNSLLASKIVTPKVVVTKNPAEIEAQKNAPIQDPGEGKIWFESYNMIWTGLKTEFLNTPQNLVNLPSPAHQKQLDQLTEQIIVQQGLGQKSAEELHRILSDTGGTALHLADSIAQAEEALKNPRKQQNGPQLQSQPQKQQEKPEVQNQVQNQSQNSFRNRIRMFEPNQPGQAGLGKS